MASRPDADAAAALAARVRRAVTFCFLDIAEEAVRVTDAPYSMVFSGTGDGDLDGHTFQAVDPTLVSVTSVKGKDSGSDTVTLQLSGLIGIDGELMNTIGDKANWQGRDARLWKALLDPDDFTRIGAIWSYYTGYMSAPKILGDQTSQTISLDLESYLDLLGQASNRTYLDQQSYDPGDTSAQLAIAIANGANKRS